MNQHQIDLVQSSFAAVVPIADTAAIIFYDELFARDPSLRVLFKEDMAEQRTKLMQMLGAAVNGLDDWQSTAPGVRELGERHIAYGVHRSHYDTVGAALIATLEQGLGAAAFTPQVREAWISCYGIVSGEMLVAMEDEAVAS